MPEHQEKQVGEAFEATKANPDYKVENEAAATSAVCNNGFAAGYPCNRVDLLSMLDINDLEAGIMPISNNELNDIWGWTHGPSGREFALVGLSSGTVFVEITDPFNPVNLGNLPTMGNPNSSGNNWRDIKTYNNYAVVVSEISGHGLQIFDLTALLSASPNTIFSNTAYFNNFGSAHNVFVNEDTGFVYSVGSNQCSGGLYVVDLNNPLNPTQAGCFTADGYTHGTY